MTQQFDKGERERFEAWLVKHDGCVYLQPDEEGRYTDPETRLAWAAWNAASFFASAEVYGLSDKLVGIARRGVAVGNPSFEPLGTGETPMMDELLFHLDLSKLADQERLIDHGRQLERKLKRMQSASRINQLERERAEQVRRAVELLDEVKRLQSATLRWKVLYADSVISRQVAWIDSQARYVGVTRKGPEYLLLELPPLPDALDSRNEK